MKSILLPTGQLLCRKGVTFYVGLSNCTQESIYDINNNLLNGTSYMCVVTWCGICLRSWFKTIKARHCLVFVCLKVTRVVGPILRDHPEKYLLVIALTSVYNVYICFSLHVGRGQKRRPCQRSETTHLSGVRKDAPIRGQLVVCI